MDVLNLALLGWIYSVGCGLAIAFGMWLIIGLHRAGEDVRERLAERVIDDSLLFGIWILGLAGGIGDLLIRHRDHIDRRCDLRHLTEFLPQFGQLLTQLVEQHRPMGKVVADPRRLLAESRRLGQRRKLNRNPIE